MGYTHYYYQQQSFTQKQWEKICLDAFEVVEHCVKSKVNLAFECDVSNPPEISNNKIRFNGVGNEGHETFVIQRTKPKNQFNCGNDYFNFCKTARKPYDLAVGLILLIAKNHAPEVIKISSDGDWDVDWEEIRHAYNSLFGEDPVCPLKEVA
jgi:methylase of polypeptide subunit release factors